VWHARSSVAAHAPPWNHKAMRFNEKLSVGPRAWRCGAPTTSRPSTALLD
jgi:hypothetical protein